MPKSRTTLLAATALSLVHVQIRSGSVPTAARGMRFPVLSLAWQPAQLASKMPLPVSASSSLMGNGNLGGAFSRRYCCSHFTSSRNSVLFLGAAPMTPRAESMITE